MKKLTAKKKPSVEKKSKPSIALDLSLLKSVSEFMKDNDLLELDFASSGIEVRLKRGHVSSNTVSQPVTFSAPLPTPVAVSAAAPTSVASASQTKFHVVSSPFVGTFYRSAGPNQDPFASVGKVVASGETLCIVEAMKLMNEIESDAKGRIHRVLVEDGTPVEFGEPLFEIEPI